MRNVMKYVAMVCAGLLCLSAPAMALSLDEARRGGVVGEQRDGYVAVIKPSKEANELVAEVNSRRKAEYTRIAKENGQSPAVVGKLAAPKIISRLPSGALYEDEKGGWTAR